MGVLGGDRRPLALAHELLADPAGDARLRAAVRRARRAQHRERVRRRRADRARAAPTRSSSPTRSSACSTTPACGSGAPRAGLAFVARSARWDHAADAARGRRCATRCGARGRVAEPAGPTPPPPLAAARPAGVGGRARARVPVDSRTTREATERLFARLDDGGRRPRSSALEASERDYWDSVDDDHRASLALVFGVWHEVPSVLEKTGLRPDSRRTTCTRWRAARSPAAARSTTPTCSPTRCAASARRWTTSRRGLDFGCSSGRVVRALQAAYPEAEWHGVRPERATRSRGRASTCRGSTSRVSPQDPPLPYEDGALRLRRARSRSGRTTASAPRSAGSTRCTGSSAPAATWSSHDARPAVDRLLRADRRALAGAARARSAARSTAAASGSRPSSASAATGASSTPSGAPRSSRPSGSRRVALPAWSIEDFAVGQNADNQDMYVLRRR